jgi:3',5'-cyclic AMP phosphodiesterase CpdA
MIVADPQILDMQAYPDRPWPVRLLSQVIVDLNLRRSWRATRSLHPHAVVFLGDMMDRGRRDMPEKECVLIVNDDSWLTDTYRWEAYYRRFTSIFAQTDSAVPTYYLPGNHDVGSVGHPTTFQPLTSVQAGTA